MCEWVINVEADEVHCRRANRTIRSQYAGYVIPGLTVDMTYVCRITPDEKNEKQGQQLLELYIWKSQAGVEASSIDFVHR